jgi:hypothetical protein
MSRSTSGLADDPLLPWLYPYREDAQSTRLDGPVFRPFVPVSLVHGDRSTWLLTGLIDTGADSVLASNLLADQLEIDLDDHEGEATHARLQPSRSGRHSTTASESSTSPKRRGWDSNPRAPLRGPTVFETAPFNHSGTPPGTAGDGF